MTPQRLTSPSAPPSTTASDIPSLPDALRPLLASGAAHFGLEFGIVSHVSGDDYRVVSQSSPEGSLADGQVFPFANTYCSITLAKDAVVSINHMSQSGYRGHPCYQVFKLQTYIGAPIHQGGRTVGTVNFSSPLPYARGFNEKDDAYMRDLARKVEACIARYDQG